MKKFFLYFILLLMLFFPLFLIFTLESGYVIFGLSIILSILGFLKFEKLYNIKILDFFRYILYILIGVNLLFFIDSLNKGVSDDIVFLSIIGGIVPFLLKIEIQKRYVLLKDSLLNSYLINLISIFLAFIIAIIGFSIYSSGKVYSNGGGGLMMMGIIFYSVIVFVVLMISSTISYFMTRKK